MGVLKLHAHSDLTMPLTIMDTFEVSVRHLTNKDLRDFTKRCSRPKLDPETRKMVDEVDENEWNRVAPATYLDVSGCKGLTPQIIRKLGVPLAEDPPTDSDGFVPITAELLGELWVEAHPEKFPVPVMRLSREMLGLVEAAKKNGSPTSGG